MKNERYYFEFNKHEYWALVSVDVEENENVMEEAFDKYLTFVGGENIEEIKKEGEPIKVSEEYALDTFAKVSYEENSEYKVSEIVKKFHEEDVVLIDGGLL